MIEQGAQDAIAGVKGSAEMPLEVWLGFAAAFEADVDSFTWELYAVAVLCSR